LEGEDNFFNKGLKNLPEEHGSEQEWDKLLIRLKKEGVIAEKKNRRGIFLYLSVAATVIIGITIWLTVNTNDATRSSSNNNLVVNQKQPEQPNATPGNKTAHGATQRAIDQAPEVANEKTTQSNFKSTEQIGKQPLVPQGNTQSLSSPEKGFSKVPASDNSYTTNNPANAASKKLPGNNLNSNPVNATENLSTGNSKNSSSNADNQSMPAENLLAISAPASPKNITKENPAATSSADTEKLPAENSITTLSEDSSNSLNDKRDPSKQMAISSKDSTIPLAFKKDSVENSLPKAVAVKKDTLDQATQQSSNNQKKTPEKKTRYSWIGGYFSLDFNQYTSKDMKNTSYGESQYVLNAFDPNSDSVKRVQFTAGITGGYGFSKYFSVEGGLYYAQRKKVNKNIVVPMYASSYGESISEYFYYYNGKYLDLNIRLKWYVVKGKVSYYVAPGMFGSFNFPGKEEKRGYFMRTFYSESTHPETQKIILEPRSLGLSPCIAGGVEVQLNSKWGIYAEPSYRYSLNPVIQHATYDKIPVHHFLRTISFGIGGMYRF